jgi:hypothetical protein
VRTRTALLTKEWHSAERIHDKYLSCKSTGHCCVPSGIHLASNRESAGGAKRTDMMGKAGILYDAEHTYNWKLVVRIRTA